MNKIDVVIRRAAVPEAFQELVPQLLCGRILHLSRHAPLAGQPAQRRMYRVSQIKRQFGNLIALVLLYRFRIAIAHFKDNGCKLYSV